MALTRDEVLIVQRSGITYHTTVGDIITNHVDGQYISKVETGDQAMSGSLIVGEKIDGANQNNIGIELSKEKGTLHIRPHDDG